MADASATPATKQDVTLLKQELKQDMQLMKEGILKETKEHFEFYTAKLYKDFLGMTQDEIQIVKDKQGNHETRIVSLEQEVEALTTS